jgi:hypothetical protein
MLNTCGGSGAGLLCRSTACSLIAVMTSPDATPALAAGFSACDSSTFFGGQSNQDGGHRVWAGGIIFGTLGDISSEPWTASGVVIISRPQRVSLRWPRSFEQNFRVTKWIVGRGLSCRAERQRIDRLYQ